MSKPTTQSYFIKRLADFGYRIEKLNCQYTDTDPRSWTLIIEPGKANVFCTCFINRTEFGDNCFEFYDGGQFLPNMKIKTSSIEVIVEHLNKCGIVGSLRSIPPPQATPPTQSSNNSTKTP